MITPAHMSRKLIVMLVCLSVTALWADRSLAVQDIASFTSVKGEVRIKSSFRAKGKWLRVKKAGVTLFSGDEIRTLAGRAEITFDDGSIMNVAEDTSLTIEERPSKRKLFGFINTSFINRNIKVRFGRLWANIKQAKGKWTSFESKVAVAGVKGTTVSMYIDSNGDMQFTCDEGFVEIARSDGSVVVKMDSGKEVSIKSLGEGKTLIENLTKKGEGGDDRLEIVSGITNIALDEKEAVVIGVTDGETTIEASGEGAVDLTVGDTTATLDSGEAVTVTEDSTTGVITLTVDSGIVEMIIENPDGTATEGTLSEGSTSPVSSTVMPPETTTETDTAEPDPVIEPLPIEEDPDSSPFIP